MYQTGHRPAPDSVPSHDPLKAQARFCLPAGRINVKRARPQTIRRLSDSDIDPSSL
jgi:hypothetical protein